MALSGSLDNELDSDSGQLEGDIILSVPEVRGNNKDGVYDTLDEPILTSITRDLKAVGQKLLFALLPTSTTSILMRDWDLWGPLFLCTYIGLLLQGMSESLDSSRFTATFLLIWIGKALVTYNAVFVQKTTMSIFQCVCVVGYCLVPVAVAVTVFEVLHILHVGTDQVLLRLLLVAASVGWASFASIKILRPSTEEEKKIVVLGPIVLFYVSVGILVALYMYSDLMESVTSELISH